MLKISPRVLLYDAGSPVPDLPPEWIALPQHPSGAFGDGSHPTTRLCAGALDLLLRQYQPQAVLDVGTGTGVLARIARARGSRFVVGTDIDPEALRVASAHAGLDSFQGSLTVTDSPPDQWGSRFDLVVANILEGPLRDLAPSLTRALRPRGILIVSGFTPLQVPILRLAFTGQGLDFENESALNGWSLLMFRRQSTSCAEV